jgi:hypothetical protein
VSSDVRSEVCTVEPRKTAVVGMRLNVRRAQSAVSLPETRLDVLAA